MTERCCVLVAEDEQIDVFLLRRSFRRAGLPHVLVEVPDGEKAVDYLTGRPPFDDRVKFPFPQLFMLDLKMPKMNGFDVLAWLSGRPDMRDLPVVVLTSSPLESDAKMARKLGAREFLTKPNELDDLVTMVRGLSQRWLTGNNQVPTGLRSPAYGQDLSWAAALPVPGPESSAQDKQSL